jgi:hypothetical protein
MSCSGVTGERGSVEEQNMRSFRWILERVAGRPWVSQKVILVQIACEESYEREKCSVQEAFICLNPQAVYGCPTQSAHAAK